MEGTHTVQSSSQLHITYSKCCYLAAYNSNYFHLALNSYGNCRGIKIGALIKALYSATKPHIELSSSKALSHIACACQTEVVYI